MRAKKIIGLLLALCVLLSSAPAVSITSAAGGTVDGGSAAESLQAFAVEPGIFNPSAGAEDSVAVSGISIQSEFFIENGGEVSALGTAWDGQASDTSWWNGTDTEFHLITAEQIAGLASLVNGGNKFSGKTIYLDNDIDLGGKEWTPIGQITNIDNNAAVTGTEFAGVFDGQEHKITGLKISIVSGKMGFGLFAYSKGTIKNLGIDETSVIDLSALTADLTAVGSIVGFNYGGLVSNCYTKASITDAGNTLTKDPCIGGVVGMNDYNGIVEYCRNLGSITITSLVPRIGGIVGSSVFTRSGQGSNSIVKYCYNSATISAGNCDNMGGIVGFSRVGHIQYCYNVGTLFCTTDKKSGANISVNGIVGVANHNNVSYCYHAGTFNTPNSSAIQSAGGTASNSYYLTGSATDGKGATALGKEDLVSAVTALAPSADGISFVADTAGINNGFPVFSWQMEESGELTVTVVANLTGITVAYGTEAAALELPGTVTVTLSDNTTAELEVTWNTDSYNPATSGTQTITGRLILGDNLANPENLEASIVVTVGEAAADYTQVDSAVNAAQEKIESGLYTGTSIATLQILIAAIDWDKTASEQEQVDAIADAILNATDALIEKELEIILNISEGMVASSDGSSACDITWNANITAGSATSFEILNERIKILSYGVYYAAGQQELDAYLAGNMSAQAVLVEFDSGTDIDVYSHYGFRLKNVASGRERTAMFYLTYEYNGKTYTLFSAADTGYASVSE